MCLSLAQTRKAQAMWFLWILPVLHWHFSMPHVCLSSLCNCSIFQRTAHVLRVSSADLQAVSLVTTWSVLFGKTTMRNSCRMQLWGKSLILMLLPVFSSSALHARSQTGLLGSAPPESLTRRFDLSGQ